MLSRPDALVDLLSTGPENAAWRFLLAHGAGAPMDSAFMTAIADGLAVKGIGCDRFEFPYMAARRVDGKKRPPNKADILMATFDAAIAGSHTRYPDARLAIGGKSMGGRMATLLAAQMDAGTATTNRNFSAIVTLGYPFHPPGKPDRLRTEHFPEIAVPVLMVQGTRDPFGNKTEVPAYTLPPRATLFWSEDGDHDLKPRKSSGRTHEQSLSEAVETIAGFLGSL